MPTNINNSERCYPGLSLKRVQDDQKERHIFFARYAKDKNVADIGCGVGYGSSLIKESGAKSVVGIDIDKEIILEAQEKYPGVHFIHADATETTLADASVDLVTCFDAWHHLDHFDRFIPEMKRILRPGGLLICSVPNKHVIYLNVFHRKMLTEFYRVDFDKKTVLRFLGSDFELLEWYGQRFVKQIFVNPVVRMGLYVLGLIGLLHDRVSAAYKLANGPAVLPLSGENSRSIIFVARRT